MRVASIVVFLLFVLTACAPGSPFGPTRTPTATATPTSTATPTLTPTYTPTPTLPPHPSDLDQAFSRGWIRYDPQSGKWLVAAYRMADGERQIADFVLILDSFSHNEDINNPLRPLTVRALDENGQEVTLLWNPETFGFSLAYEIPNIQKLIEQGVPLEEIEKMIPVVSPEDFTDGTIIKSVLLAFERDGYQPFSQEAAENYAKALERNIEPRLHLDITGFDGTHVKGATLKVASLLPVSFSGEKAGENQKTTYTQQIMTPYFLRVKIGDENYLVVSLPTLNPADPKNVSPDDYIILFGIPIQQERNFNTIFWQRLLTLEHIVDQNQRFTPFLTCLYAQRQDGAPLDPQSPNLLESILAQLSSLSGNDVTKLTDSVDPHAFYFPSSTLYYLNELGHQEHGFGNVIEVIVSPSTLPPEMQRMLFILEVSSAR